MTSPADDDPLQRPDEETTGQSVPPSLDVRKTRSPTRRDLPNASTQSLPLRPSSPGPGQSRAPTRTSTLASTLSRSSSPNGRLSLSLSRFGRASIASPLANPSESYDELRTIIVRAFSPMVAICAADEADILARSKGIQGGFAALIRPYGERIAGKVVVRDSVGASRAWDDFGIHVSELGALTRVAAAPQPTNELDRLEEIMEQAVEHQGNTVGEEDIDASDLYRHYLSRLLQSHSIGPHEAFLHPVCAAIVITSSTPQPIDTLRNLYQQTAQGSRTLPTYANPEYLRYYVLVHDEDHDDFAKTSALFDQMKRHFGLHCHLLRLRSTTIGEADESEPIPECEWLSPSEDLSDANQRSNLIDLDGDTSTPIFSEDAVAIRAFLRELVAQSVIPHMEQRIALWNEQIASRRKGLSGRFMSISRRWGGFGVGGSSRNSSSVVNSSSATGNYDSLQQLYRYDTPEALLAKLAAFAFMLRDYKLAASTMELVRNDFNNDKAYKYAASANEICCAASLLNPLTGTASAKFKLDNFDQMLDTAVNSYLHRAPDPAMALRSTILGLELLKPRGKAAAEVAAKHGIRAIELGLVTPGSIGHVLLSERIASSFGSQVTTAVSAPNTSVSPVGSRRRKAALWNVMVADEWMKLGMAAYADARLESARDLYADTRHPDALALYTEMDGFMQQLAFTIRIKLGQGKRGRGLSTTSEVMAVEVDDEIVEDMGAGPKGASAGETAMKGHRRNLSLATANANVAGAGEGPSSPGLARRGDPLGALPAAEADFE
jgi:trafficking protein particle complex subunit 8